MEYSFLVASDVDYTLLMTGKPVSKANKEAIDAIRDMGGAFTLATGRTSYLTGAYILDLGLDVPLITSNGAAVYDPISRKDLYSSLIPDRIVKEFIKVFYKNNTNSTCYSPEAIYFAPGCSRREFIANYNSNLPLEYKAPTKELTLDMATNNTPAFNKFLFISPDRDSLNFAYSFDELEIVSSAPTFYDIMAKGATKGDGLLRVADILNIPHNLTFALGDSDNDLSMVELASHGIAMGNANDNVKSAAKYVTDTCENDGLAKAVFEYIIPTVKEIIGQ